MTHRNVEDGSSSGPRRSYVTEFSGHGVFVPLKSSDEADRNRTSLELRLQKALKRQQPQMEHKHALTPQYREFSQLHDQNLTLCFGCGSSCPPSSRTTLSSSPGRRKASAVSQSQDSYFSRSLGNFLAMVAGSLPMGS